MEEDGKIVEEGGWRQVICRDHGGLKQVQYGDKFRQFGGHRSVDFQLRFLIKTIFTILLVPSFELIFDGFKMLKGKKKLIRFVAVIWFV